MRGLWPAGLLWIAVAGAAVAQHPAIEPLRIVTLGTSLTARGGWDKMLEQQLEHDIGGPVELHDFAQVGGTSRSALATLPQAFAARPDLVILEFAANDSALDEWLSVQQSVDNIDAIVAAARQANPAVAIYLQQMNPVHGPRSLIRPFIVEYWDAHRRLAAELCLRFVDHSIYWEQYDQAALEALIPDGLHPLPDRSSSAIAETLAAAIMATPLTCPAQI